MEWFRIRHFPEAQNARGASETVQQGPREQQPAQEQGPPERAAARNKEEVEEVEELKRQETALKDSVAMIEVQPRLTLNTKH